MTDIERLEELIENYFDIDYLANTCKIHPKCIHQFKKDMLKILLTDEQKLKLLVDYQSNWEVDALKRQLKKSKLPWRDFEKETPDDNSIIIHWSSLSSFFETRFSKDRWEDLSKDIPHILKGKWIYKEDLLATLPKEEDKC